MTDAKTTFASRKTRSAMSRSRRITCGALRPSAPTKNFLWALTPNSGTGPSSVRCWRVRWASSMRPRAGSGFPV